MACVIVICKGTIFWGIVLMGGFTNRSRLRCLLPGLRGWFLLTDRVYDAQKCLLVVFNESIRRMPLSGNACYCENIRKECCEYFRNNIAAFRQLGRPLSPEKRAGKVSDRRTNINPQHASVKDKVTHKE